MVVFNLYAIPAVIVIGIVYGILAAVAPAFADGPYGDLTVCAVAFVVGAITELVGLKGRLFWMPIWLIALLAGTYQAYQLWGMVGIAGGVGVLVGASGILFATGRSAEAGMVREAPERLEAARAAIRAGEVEAFWEHMEGAYLPPVFGGLRPDVAKHLAACFELMLGNAARLGLEGDRQRMLALGKRIAEHHAAPRTKAPGFFSKESAVLAWPEKLARERGKTVLEAFEVEDLAELEKKDLGGGGARPG